MQITDESVAQVDYIPHGATPTDTPEDLETKPVDKLFYGADKVWPQKYVAPYVTFSAQSLHFLDVNCTKWTMEYSYNKETWVDATNGYVPFGAGKGDLYLRGTDCRNTEYTQNLHISEGWGPNHEHSEIADIKIEGDVRVLYNSDNYERPTGVYCRLFEDFETLYDASDFVIEELWQESQCEEMFKGCRGLKYAPRILPSKTLTPYCYTRMFASCINLTDVPILPATELKQSCYWGMFTYCRSLTTMPDLPAEIMATSCYAAMFLKCDKLVRISKIDAKRLARYCFDNMFNGCSMLESSFAVNSESTAVGCYNSMYEDCVSLLESPILWHTQLQNDCYKRMFAGCTNLRKITCRWPQVTTTNVYSQDWVESVYNIGEFRCPDNGLTQRTQIAPINDSWGIPVGWTIVKNVPELEGY